MEEWKTENREKYLAMRKKYRDKYKALWMDIIMSVFDPIECQDCGYSAHIELLEWHHEEGKEEAPNRIFSRKPTVDRILEISTCIPLCPTCHRSRHQYGEPK